MIRAGPIRRWPALTGPALPIRREHKQLHGVSTAGAPDASFAWLKTSLSPI